MTTKTLAALTLVTGLIAFLAVLYVFHPRDTPQVSSGKPEALQEVPYRSAPEFAGKPAPPGPSPPPVTEPPAASPTQTHPAPPERPAAEMKPSVGPAESSSPPTSEEHYGLLVGRYRTYKEAGKVMEKVQKQGKPAFIRHERGQRRPYAVWAGPFSSQEESKAAAKAIKARLKIAAKTEKLLLPVPK